MISSPGREPAVDDQVLAADVAGGVARQENQRPHELFGPCHAAERYSSGIALVEGGILTARDSAGRERVYPYAARSPVRGEVAREADQTRLGSAVHGRRVDPPAEI